MAMSSLTYVLGFSVRFFSASLFRLGILWSLGGPLSKLCVTPPFSINFRCQIENQVSDYRLLGASSCWPLLFILLLLTIIVYPFIVDHDWLSFYCWPLLFILLLLTIIVYPFIVNHYSLSFYCRLLLFILSLSTIFVYPLIVDHYCLSFYCRLSLFILLLSTIIVLSIYCQPLLFILLLCPRNKVVGGMLVSPCPTVRSSVDKSYVVSYDNLSCIS
jgi:hypothetical protein